MLNFVIVENNLNESKNIINFLSKNNADIRLYNMASTGKQAIKILREKNIDFFILDINLPDLMGIDIINFISKNNYLNYKSSIILIGDEEQFSLKYIKNPYVYCYFTKPINLENISECIKKLTNKKKEELDKERIYKKIDVELSNLNFNFSYKGTKYLKECIFELYLAKNMDFDNLSKNIYPILALKHNKTVNNIHCNIKQSVKAMYYDCEEKTITKYFNYSVFTKPKLKEVIFTILSKL